MSSNTSLKRESYFPLTVSGMLVVIIGLCIAIVFRAETHLFSSLFDRIGLNLLVIIILLLSIIWLLTLVFESFALSLRKLLVPFKWMLFFIYYPLGRAIGWLFRMTKEDFQTSFLSFQNRLFFPNLKLDKQAQLLIILPHCLQFHDCKIRITRDISDCAGCGKCDICKLKDLGGKYNVRIGIANGGTLARKIVSDAKPAAIIAVACHRDLTDGVRESWNYPVYAILNERPFGPCIDTKVNVENVESIINQIVV
jgi:hypothetical protein